MDYSTLLQNLGFFVVSAGFIAWVIKGLVVHALDKDLEAMKARQDGSGAAIAHGVLDAR